MERSSSGADIHLATGEVFRLP